MYRSRARMLWIECQLSGIGDKVKFRTVVLKLGVAKALQSYEYSFSFAPLHSARTRTLGLTHPIDRTKSCGPSGTAKQEH
ncbi:hypothetical protein Tco_0853035 [Tanacetum coccineum]